MSPRLKSNYGYKASFRSISYDIGHKNNKQHPYETKWPSRPYSSSALGLKIEARQVRSLHFYFLSLMIIVRG